MFAARSRITDQRLQRLFNELASVDPKSACVYATGSVARGEANEHSDLDIFIVDSADESNGELKLSQLDATLLKADLIRASQIAGFPPFTGDGIHLQVHTVSDIVKKTGSAVDDSSNAFTARLLLILESRVIMNEPAHERAKREVIDRYWSDFPQNAASFLPVYLVNDIMRYWKTLCLNYEAGRLGGMPSGYETGSWKRRNQLKNIKLKFSRLWMCHSTIAYLLWLSSEGKSVTPEDMSVMMTLTPFERLDAIRKSGAEPEAVGLVIQNYAWFLERFSGGREDSLKIVGERDAWLDARTRGSQFAASMSELLASLGQETALYRFLIV